VNNPANLTERIINAAAFTCQHQKRFMSGDWVVVEYDDGTYDLRLISADAGVHVFQREHGHPIDGERTIAVIRDGVVLAQPRAAVPVIGVGVHARIRRDAPCETWWQNQHERRDDCCMLRDARAVGVIDQHLPEYSRSFVNWTRALTGNRYGYGHWIDDDDLELVAPDIPPTIVNMRSVIHA